MTCTYLTPEDVVVVASVACGGAQPLVRDAGLLACAAHRHSAVVLGRDAYPDLVEKAAALLHSLASSRLPPLLTGNRRTAFLSCATFLALNGVELRPDIDAGEGLVLDVADGGIDDVGEIAQRLRELLLPKPM
ncbi:type II toxin-antitoxin system death-on-curing family toxin [Streptomyces sp. NPDC057011]|uniref:type II toxin-antitoxin system death-on-curing family toxin n=1 Tax=unclassified Streptomyces TaxID=2593676 RepID=UPI003643131E